MLLIGSGVLHISAAADHTNLPVMAVGFVVVAALQAGLGAYVLSRRPGRWIVIGGLGLTLGALGTWLLSRTAGLPLLPGGHMEPIGFKDGITVLFESGTLAALALLASSELDQIRLPSPRLGTHALGLLGAAIFALFVPAFMLGGGEHHSGSEMAGHEHGGESEEDAHDADGLADAVAGHVDDGHDHGDGTGSGAGDAGHEDHEDHQVHESAEELLASADAADGHHHSASSDAASDTGGGHADHHGDDSHKGHEPAEHDEAGKQHDHGDKQHEHGGKQHQRHGGDHKGHSDDGHGEQGHDDHGGHAEPADSGERSIAVESGHDGGPDRRPQGPAVVIHDRPNERVNGKGHAHSAPCNPTPEQQAYADELVAAVRAELKPYENNPAAAFADGFDYAFGPTDRMIHMADIQRINDPDVLKPGEIESFIYYMTDTGFVPIGGMFVMPAYGQKGPEPGGCLTKWHHHGGIVGRWATAGTSDNTPEMMHVFTYPGLDPWGHYNGRDLASLWTPGRYLPSVCRESGDANDGCFP